MRRPALALQLASGLALSPAMAQQPPETQSAPPGIHAQLVAATTMCTDIDSGELTGQDQALRPIDLTGTGEGWVLDSARLNCSTSASLFCGGTGGCPLSLSVGDHVTTLMTKGWKMVNFPPFRVVMAQVHGSFCDGINPTPCVTALVWDAAETRFRATGNAGQ